MKYSERFRIKRGDKLKLDKIDPAFTDGLKETEAVQERFKKHVKRLGELQYSLYAEGTRSLLICLQGLDAAGKDGTIVHVLGGAMDPLGTRVCGFKVPSLEEAAHDFLWRIEKQVPAKGEVVIFNRSHYEDVLVVRVHKTVPEEVWSKRYNLINHFEKGLVVNGTQILKFFLHISPEEQLNRFQERLDDPLRQWKISDADYKERKYWEDYTRAYEDALRETSTRHSPWYVIPSDNKWFRDLAIAQIVVEKLESMRIKLPKPQVDLNEIRRKYHQAVVQEEKK